ncbi:DUF3027 domain-containing protein [Spongisporangium articulatum]|uniref:DUF3027 domain-containing protein n=1 Tax=Spongisporangium articulatum TaxID=3362603 RepID=A0ABW8AJ82_9ACTN
MPEQQTPVGDAPPVAAVASPEAVVEPDVEAAVEPAVEPEEPAAAPVLDDVSAAAVDLAREAAVETAGAEAVGEHTGVSVEAGGLAVHTFAALMPGYRGWGWAVSLARPAGQEYPTVCEVVLLPQAEAVLAPEWVPWSDRLAPGDLGPGDELPYKPDDPYLVPGYEVTDDAELTDDEQQLFWELGLGRERVLGPEGVRAAAERWHASAGGPTSDVAIQASAPCVSCGYFVSLSGLLRQDFGVCANEWSPSDGRVVTADHGCGAHSETDLQLPVPEPLPPVILDESLIDEVTAADLEPLDEPVAEIAEAEAVLAVEPVAEIEADIAEAEVAEAEVVEAEVAQAVVPEATQPPVQPGPDIPEPVVPVPDEPTPVEPGPDVPGLPEPDEPPAPPVLPTPEPGIAEADQSPES